MAQQVKTITSEALEAAYRALTPAQEGFTEDLMASNTIIPVLDLTADAGGVVPEYQSQALAFGNQTSFNISNSLVTLANTAGFWRVIGTSVLNVQAGGAELVNQFSITDGLTSKIIWSMDVQQNTATSIATIYDFIVFLRSGDSLTGTGPSNSTGFLQGSYRQVADVNGVVVNPVGFTPQ